MTVICDNPRNAEMIPSNLIGFCHCVSSCESGVWPCQKIKAGGILKIAVRLNSTYVGAGLRV